MQRNSQLTRVTGDIPKLIDQRTHAVLDYTTVIMLAALGVKLRNQHRQASRFAFLNAATVFAASALTNYPGGLLKKISFQTHGLLDVAQAGMLVLGPALLGFGRAEAQLFYAQAAMEVGVVAATDWESSVNMPASVA